MDGAYRLVKRGTLIYNLLGIPAGMKIPFGYGDQLGQARPSLVADGLSCRRQYLELL